MPRESQMGVGFMLRALGGADQDPRYAINMAAGKRIASMKLDENIDRDGALVIQFEDGSKLTAQDTARSCCEARFLTTDDDLPYFAGAQFLNVEVLEAGAHIEELPPIETDDEGNTIKVESVVDPRLVAPTREGEYGEVHEVMFMRVHTTKGIVVVASHNEHNGYYGGISLEVRYSAPPA